MTTQQYIFASGTIFKLIMAAVFLFVAAPAMALQTEWNATEGGRMRLSVDPIADKDGVLHGALEIDLDKGWKTYWIDPGAAGIPPQIDLAGSQGISLKSMRMPAPVRVDDGYSVWAGYKHPVAYALTFEREGAAMLRASVFIGICEDICVPFQARFSLEIPAEKDIFQSDVAAQTAVARAKASLPGPPRPDFNIIAASHDPADNAIVITIRRPKAEQQSGEANVFVARDGWFFGPPELTTQNETTASYRIPVLRQPKVKSSQGAPLYVVVTSGEHAIEAHMAVDGTDK